MPAELILLHGFTQTGASWDGVRGALPLPAETLCGPHFPNGRTPLDGEDDGGRLL